MGVGDASGETRGCTSTLMGMHASASPVRACSTKPACTPSVPRGGSMADVPRAHSVAVAPALPLSPNTPAVTMASHKYCTSHTLNKLHSVWFTALPYVCCAPLLPGAPPTLTFARKAATCCAVGTGTLHINRSAYSVTFTHWASMARTAATCVALMPPAVVPFVYSVVLLGLGIAPVLLLGMAVAPVLLLGVGLAPVLLLGLGVGPVLLLLGLGPAAVTLLPGRALGERLWLALALALVLPLTLGLVLGLGVCVTLGLAPASVLLLPPALPLSRVPLPT
mmetsp:Transcript_36581/g.91715  ORF Transcript_36581/g.91715 Transcript_36581/m.91715 type:complete len:279 (+) Transcript_36581:132-968(+)